MARSCAGRQLSASPPGLCNSLRISMLRVALNGMTHAIAQGVILAHRFAGILFLSFCLVTPSHTETRRPEPDEAARKWTTIKKPLRKAAETEGKWEVFKDITVDAGKSVVLDSRIDYSSLDKVAVAVRSASDSLSDLEDLILQTFWSVPDADYFSAAEIKFGRTFPFTNSGSVLFGVYGSEFRLILRNEGGLSLKVGQLLIFCRSQ